METISTASVGGLNLDSELSILKEGEITYCLNGKFFLRGGSYYYVNYEGNVLCTSIPTDQYLLNATRTNNPDQFIIFSVQSDNTNPSIGILTGCTYELLVQDDCLGFRIDKQISAEFKESFGCGRTVYWTDDNEPRRYLDIDNIPDPFDCDFIQIDKKFEYPCIDIEIQTQGALLSGAYFLFFQYSDINGTGLTSWSPSTNRVDIITRENSVLGAGDKAGTQTNKSIEVSLTGLDTGFTNYNLAVIKQINGVLSAQFIITLPTTTSSYNYTGNESSTIDITVNELVIVPTIYKRFKGVQNTLGYLQWYNIHGKIPYNYQPFANDIQVQFVTYRVKATDYYNKNHPYFNLMSLMRDEIYPIGIRLIRDTGEKTCTYHIPGRQLDLRSNGDDFTAVVDQYGFSIDPLQWDSQSGYSGANLLNGQDGDTPRWQIYNTGELLGDTPEFTQYVNDGGDPTLYEGCYSYGEMSYWESTLTYPNIPDVWNNGVIDLAGLPIRHHKMPDCSIDHIHENFNGSATISEYPYLHILGIQCNNIQIDPALFPDIVGYEIVIGDRTFQKSIIAKGILYNNMKHTEPGGASDPVVPAPYYYTNWLYNDMASASNFSQTDDVTHDYFSFWSPETTFKNTNLGSVFELKFESEEYGKFQSSWYDYSSPTANVNTGTNTENGINFLGNLLFSTGWYNNYILANKDSVRREIIDIEYILNNSYQSSSLGNINNLYRESTIMFNVNSGVTDCAKKDDSKSFGSGITIGVIASYYTSLKNDIPNLWGNIGDVNYIAPFNMCSVGRDEVDTGCLFGGDTFISFFSFHKRTLYPQFVSNVGIANTNDILNPNGEFGGDGSGGNDPFQMYYANPVFYCESSVNTNYRYSGLTNKETFYPNLKDLFLQLYNFQSPTNMWPDVDNYYLYNQDYSKLRNINSICTQPDGFTPDDCEEHFYTRSIYSEKDQTEGVADNWLVYKPNNFYDFAKSKGELWDIQNLSGDRVLYRFNNGIFLKQLNQRLQTNNEDNVEIGTGSLYDPEPVELFNVDTGYIGTRSQWAFNSTPYGSFMIDDVRGNIFKFTDSFTPISNTKMISWFNSNLKLNLLNDYPTFPNYDNPYNPNGIGFISTYDSKNKIWICTKRDFKVFDQENKPSMEEDGRFYFGEGEEKTYVDLSDTEVFINKSWTIGYSTEFNVWISWYSFIPLFYIEKTDTYLSGVDNDIYSHNSIDTFSTYYTVEYPYILEIPNKSKTLVSKLNTIFWKTFCYSPNEDSEEFWYENKNITFDSGFVYNTEQNTGFLNFIVQNPNLPSQSITYPITNIDSTDVLISKQDGIWSLNYLWDKINNRNNSTPFMTNSWSNSDYIAAFPIDKVLDQSTINYNKNWYDLKPIKGQFNKTRLYFNQNDVILNTIFTIEEQDESVRN
jgi:hypothetical protein